MTPAEILIVELALYHHDPERTRAALVAALERTRADILGYQGTLTELRGRDFSDRRAQVVTRMVELAIKASRLQSAVELLDSVIGEAE